jgi:hypothetical protein
MWSSRQERWELLRYDGNVSTNKNIAAQISRRESISATRTSGLVRMRLEKIYPLALAVSDGCCVE